MIMAAELVSVIVPAYNAGKHLRRCVDSILRQTHHQLELIVVNDCSTDDTGRLLDELAAGDERLKVIHLGANAGIHAARSFGVRAATGQYLGFVDADDWIAPGMYAELIQASRDHDADIVVCGARIVSPENQTGGSKVHFRRHKVLSDDLLGRFCRLEFGSGVLWNKLYRTDVMRPFAERPLDRRVDASEDYIVNIGCFAQATRVVTLPADHYYYCCQLESASRAGNNARRFARVMRAYVTCLETYANTLRAHFAQIDVLYARQLSLGCYAVSPSTELAVCDAELSESLRRLSVVHPAGVYALIHAFDTQAAPRDRGFKTAFHDFSSSARALIRAGRRELRRAPQVFRLHPAKS